VDGLLKNRILSFRANVGTISKDSIVSTRVTVDRILNDRNSEFHSHCGYYFQIYHYELEKQCGWAFEK
jgi:hypothetical protein